jgi:TatA/E family protein of Tat protein translocase
MPFINGIGPGELIIILIIALIVVGPGKLPDVGSALGKSIREFRKAATDVQESVSLDAAPKPAAPATPAVPAPAAAPALPPAPVVAAAVAAEPAAEATVEAAVAPPVAANVAPAATVAAPADLAPGPVEPAAPGEPAAPAAVVSDTDAGEWPAEAVPVDEQQPSASV